MSEEVPVEKSDRVVLNNASFASEDTVKVFGQLVNVNDNNVLHEPTCLICSNPLRSEVEQLFVEKKTYKEIQTYLKDKTDLSFPKSVLENHMLYHFNREIRELQKREYIDRLARLTDQNHNLTTLQRISIDLAALDERLTGINSIVPSGDISAAEVEKIKSAETAKLINSANALLKFKAQILGEMKESGELVTVPKKVFIEIFNEALAHARNDGEKQALQNLVKKLEGWSSATQ